MSNNQYPDGWTEMTFGEMAEQVSERVDDPKTAGVEVYVGLEHLDPEDLRIRRRGTPDDVEATKLRVRPGQIIFGKRRAYQRKVAVADFDGIASAHAMILQEKPALYPGFLPFFMQSDVFMDRAVTISEGGLSPTIKWKTLAAEKFLLPPPEQQRELVELMQGFERAIEAGEASLGASEDLYLALLSRLLSHIGQPMQLSEIATVTIGRQLSPKNKQGVREKPYLRALNVNSGKINLDDINYMDFTEKEEEKYRLKSGDTLIVEGGASVGHCAKFLSEMGEFCFQNTLLRIRPLDIKDSEYIYFLMFALHKVGFLEKLAKGSGIRHLGVNGVEKIKVMLPEHDSRSGLVARLQAAQALVEQTAATVQNMRDLRFSILNTALSPSAQAEVAAEGTA